jgi:hypothetical protein
LDKHVVPYPSQSCGINKLSKFYPSYLLHCGGTLSEYGNCPISTYAYADGICRNSNLRVKGISVWVYDSSLRIKAKLTVAGVCNGSVWKDYLEETITLNGYIQLVSRLKYISLREYTVGIRDINSQAYLEARGISGGWQGRCSRLPYSLIDQVLKGSFYF